MTVWIVTAGWVHGDRFILGVFATEEGANAYVQTLRVDLRGRIDDYDYVRVHPYEVTL
jgi:hypothetical protein